MPNPDDIGDVLVSARSFLEYRAMFALGDSDLVGPVLDCPGGGSSFTAGAVARGAAAFAADPVYARPVDELAAAVVLETRRGTAHTVAGGDRYRWDFFNSPAEHRRIRERSALEFVADVRAHPERYVAATLPNLPFRDRMFQLVLSSHLLFTYADRFDVTFHQQALLELHRVTAGEARVFPLLDQAGRDQRPLVERLRAQLADSGVESEVRTVDYEFQRGGNRMLVVAGSGSAGESAGG